MMHPTALHHMVMSSRQSYADLHLYHRRRTLALSRTGELKQSVGSPVSAAALCSARFASSGCDAGHQLHRRDDGNALV